MQYLHTLLRILWLLSLYHYFYQVNFLTKILQYQVFPYTNLPKYNISLSQLYLYIKPFYCSDTIYLCIYHYASTNHYNL